MSIYKNVSICLNIQRRRERERARWTDEMNQYVLSLAVEQHNMQHYTNTHTHTKYWVTKIRNKTWSVIAFFVVVVLSLVRYIRLRQIKFTSFAIDTECENPCVLHLAATFSYDDV